MQLAVNGFLNEGDSVPKHIGCYRLSDWCIQNCGAGIRVSRGLTTIVTTRILSREETACSFFDKVCDPRQVRRTFPGSADQRNLLLTEKPDTPQ